MALYPKIPLRGLALCAGVGGLELGLHIAEPDYKTVCFVERQAFPAATLVARMEDKALDQAPIWDDLTTFDGKPWRGKISVITGGYPCQPFSQCGQRQGDKDPRHLWPHIARLIKEIEPTICFFENVEGHLTLGADVVIKDLQSMGFRVKTGLFSALEVGASHIRRRLFIMAYADPFKLQHQDRVELGKGRHESTPCDGGSGKTVFNSVSGKGLDADMAVNEKPESGHEPALSIPVFSPPPSDFCTWQKILDKQPNLQPSFLRLDDGLADRVERSEAAGNGVVSLVAAYAWQTLKAAHEG